MPTLPRLRGLGGGCRGKAASRISAEVLQRPGLPAHPVPLPGRKGGTVPLLMCTAPLLSSRWPGTKRRGPEQRDLYAAPSPRGLPGPVFFSSRAAGIQWAETLPPAPLWRHKRPFCAGAPEPLPRGGERQGLLQRADCVLGPREQAGPGQRRTGASLSPACRAAGRRGARLGPRPRVRGLGWRGDRWRGPCPRPRPPPHGPLGRGRSGRNGGSAWLCGVRNPTCQGPAQLCQGGWGRQPQLTFEGRELFHQVFFVTVLLVTQKLLERQKKSAGCGVNGQSSLTRRPIALVPAPMPGGRAWPGRAGGPSVCPGLLSTPQRQICSPRRGQEVCSAARGAARRACPKYLQSASELPVWGTGPAPAGHPSSKVHGAASPKGKLPGSSINSLGMRPQHTNSCLPLDCFI